MSDYLIALTGGIGAGKTTVAEMFAKKGVPVWDADLVSHELTSKEGLLFQKVEAHFGKDILTPDGEIDRVALRKRIFKNIAERKWLEKILHPLVYEKLLERAKKENFPYCIVVIPLLVETCKQFPDFYRQIQRILVVDAAQESQEKRASTREAWTVEQVHEVMDAQATRAKRLQAADDVITNVGDMKALQKQVEALHERYFRLGKARGR
jgi:dephospho-CoA kinase